MLMENLMDHIDGMITDYLCHKFIRDMIDYIKYGIPIDNFVNNDRDGRSKNAILSLLIKTK